MGDRNSAHTIGFTICAQSRNLLVRNANCVTWGPGCAIDQGSQRQDAYASQRKIGLDFLNCGARALTALLPIECQQYANGLCACLTNQLDRLANGGARRNHIVDDNDTPREFRAHEQATFAVILRLFAVECEWHVAVVLGCECCCRRGHERYPFVCGAKQHVVAEPRGLQGRRITTTERRDGFAKPALKKYGLMRPDFNLNSPKRSASRRMARAKNSL
jgi:hypothetical protein